jgi:hypothetical protein
MHGIFIDCNADIENIVGIVGVLKENGCIIYKKNIHGSIESRMAR